MIETIETKPGDVVIIRGPKELSRIQMQLAEIKAQIWEIRQEFYKNNGFILKDKKC